MKFISFSAFNALQFTVTLSKIQTLILKNLKFPEFTLFMAEKIASKMTYEGEQKASLYSQGFIITKFSNIADALTLLALKGSLTDNIQISGFSNHKIVLKYSLLI